MVFFSNTIGEESTSVNFFLAAFSICCGFEESDDQLLLCQEEELNGLGLPLDFPCIVQETVQQFEQFKIFFFDTENGFCADASSALRASECDPLEKDEFLDDISLLFLPFWYSLGVLCVILVLLQICIIMFYFTETKTCYSCGGVNEMERVRAHKNGQLIGVNKINPTTSPYAEPEKPTAFDAWKDEFKKRQAADQAADQPECSEEKEVN